jgi:hypothetical protein
MRSVVRSIGALSPLLIGWLSDQWGLRVALAAVAPLYGAGGLVMLLAARSYPTDLSFVVAESRRIREADQARRRNMTATSGDRQDGGDG